MKNAEIERKFLVKNMPDITNLPKIVYERHYLYISSNIELRVQRKNDKYEIERKYKTSSLTRLNQKMEITREEFMKLVESSDSKIIRDSYLVEENDLYSCSIKIYHGQHSPLIRAEVEFSDEKSAKAFVPFVWFGGEITESELGKDSKLIKLPSKEISTLIERYL